MTFKLLGATAGLLLLIQITDGITKNEIVIRQVCGKTETESLILRNYRVFIKYWVSFLNVVIFLMQCWYLTCRCVHTLTPRGNRTAESGIYFKIFEKTQYLMNTLYLSTLHILLSRLNDRAALSSISQTRSSFQFSFISYFYY